jgi:hypothetical protein
MHNNNNTLPVDYIWHSLDDSPNTYLEQLLYTSTKMEVYIAEVASAQQLERGEPSLVRLSMLVYNSIVWTHILRYFVVRNQEQGFNTQS